MRSKNIFVLDDEPSARLPLLSSLKSLGFNAEGASNVNEARALLDKLKDKIDVMVLDMRLEDPQHPHTTGADIGLEARELIRRCPPEFLILSGYKQVDYYEYALKLDVAAYLVKTEVSAEDVIRHIQSLALRRALSFEKPEIDEKIREIAEINSTPADAVASFCRKLLAPEIKSCIGLPAVFLLTDTTGTRNCSSDVDLPNDYNAAYSTIQALAQGELNPDSPFVVDIKQLSAPPDRETCDIYERLDGGAFLPLFVTHGLRLSIGLLQLPEKNGRAFDNPAKTARLAGQEKYKGVFEDPIKIASILSSYLRPAILEHLFRMLSLLTESNTKRETLLKHTARFCSWVGQEQSAILIEAQESGEVDSTKDFFQKFKALSTNLRHTGESLSSLFKEKVDETTSVYKVTPSVIKVIEDAWKEAQEQFNAFDVPMEIEGKDFSLPISHEDLFPAAMRVFQWMVQRKDKTVANVQQRITVALTRDDEQAEIVFSDQSRRLGERLRRVLFDPFTQATLTPPLPTGGDDDDEDNDKKKAGRYFPLFLAKMLVEVKYNGSLADKTGALESEGAKHGHRFAMSFPLEREEAQANAVA